MIPAPVAVAYALLIALPTIKLIAAVISRRSWCRIRVLEAQLDADPALTEADREHVRSCVAEAFGHPALMLLPFAVPVAMPVAAVVCAFIGIKEVDRHEAERRLRRLEMEHDRIGDSMAKLIPGYDPVSKWLHHDERLKEISDLAFPLAFLRYPLTALATICMIILTGWMPMMTLGVHYGGKYLLRALRDVTRTNTLSPLFSVHEILGA